MFPILQRAGCLIEKSKSLQHIRMRAICLPHQRAPDESKFVLDARAGVRERFGALALPVVLVASLGRRAGSERRARRRAGEGGGLERRTARCHTDCVFRNPAYALSASLYLYPH